MNIVRDMEIGMAMGDTTMAGMAEMGETTMANAPAFIRSSIQVNFSLFEILWLPQMIQIIFFSY